MSYSFTVNAKDKAEAKQMVEQKLGEVIAANQPMHEKDKAAALANASACIDLLSGDDKAIEVSVHGSIGWDGKDAEHINGVGINCSARQV